MAKASKRTTSKVRASRGNKNDAPVEMWGQWLKASSETMESQASLAIDEAHPIVVLPLPALCLRYLFAANGYPLSRITQICGYEGCAKSTFLYEMYRWHLLAGGGAAHIENENKDAADFRNSLLGYNPEYLSRVVETNTVDLEGWQNALTSLSASLRDLMQPPPAGFGKTMLTAIGVDSITATATRDEIAKIEKAGYAERGYALLANLITRYMRSMPRRIAEFPISIIGINHLKPAAGDQLFAPPGMPGGNSVKFMETMEIHMHKAAKGADIQRGDVGGLRVEFKAKKCAVGPSRRSIMAEVLWWWDARDGEFRQRTAWDWYAASTELLLSLEPKLGKTKSKAILDICGIRAATQRRAYSDLLGVPKDDPQPYHTIGLLLEQHPTVLRQVEEQLGILRYRCYEPGVDYGITAAAARQDAASTLLDDYNRAGVCNSPGDIVPQALPEALRKFVPEVKSASE